MTWSECPYGADPSMDKTNGAYWQLFYVDLKTKKITKVDAYKEGLCVPDKSQDGYLCPDQVHINQNYISYVTFDYNSMGSVTNVVKLYDMESKNLKVIDYLNDDLVTHYFTCSAAENGRLAWSREQLNPDGTYISTTYLYDIKTTRKAKVETDKNIGFPVLVGNFLCVQNNPNKTFYDSEVCIYDINASAWVYKINNGLSGINEISYPRLLDGGLFVWESIKYGDSSHPDSHCDVILR